MPSGFRPLRKTRLPQTTWLLPFDHYDLGDKFHKGDVRTRFGSKDEFLRMVAVLHQNGIEVIQDVVFNHSADTANGDGG